MVIGFKQQFVNPILQGKKIHTIREDKQKRWKPGMLMHMATGVRTKNYNCFHKSNLLNKQRIIINRIGTRIIIEIDYTIVVNFDTKNDFYENNIQFKTLQRLSHNDGFECINDFLNWFNSDFKGYILHWTNYKY